MFDGVPIEQFHQFISTPSSRVPSNSSLIQTPPISTSTNLNFLSFDPLLFPPPLPTHHQHHNHSALFQSHHFLRTPTRDQYDSEGKVDHEIDLGIATNDSWSNDEVIQLLRIKSSSENWFRDFTWDHVSRKLAEMGYKRSAEKCKEKFEEETCRSFSSTIGYNKNSSRYMISEELDDHLFNANHHQLTIDTQENANHQGHQKQEEEEDNDDDDQVQGQKSHFVKEPSEVIMVQRQKGHFEKDPSEMIKVQGQKGHFKKDPTEVIMVQGQKGHFEKDPSEVIMVQTTQEIVQVEKNKKRKRKHKKFKMVKGLCVDLVKTMMVQQEEMHRKLLEDVMNRDEEKIKREEAWRNEEMERVKREIHIREQEQGMAINRQSTITEFLNKFNSLDQKIQLPFEINFKELQSNLKNIEKSIPMSEIPKIPSLDKITARNPNQEKQIAKDDIGKRWPKDEVLALISIRSKVSNGIVNNDEEQEGYNGNFNKGGTSGGGGGTGGGSLWERISQGMLELGYRRSAKRCKEKWENINKYFRKTKDANKKRPLDSRTCPYYHQLSKMYNQEQQVSSSKSVGISSGESEKCPEAKNHAGKLMGFARD